MSFVKLEEHSKDRTQEYYIRTDLIREVNITKDEQGKIVLLSIFIEENNLQENGVNEYEFKNEDAEKTFSNMYALLSSSKILE
jgi:hypothetical protein